MNIDIYLKKSYDEMSAWSSNLSSTINFIVPVFQEVKRMQPNSDDNPTGEDFVAIKIAQLDNFFTKLDVKLQYKLIFIDDGDDIECTGKVIEKYLAKHYPQHIKKGKVAVWYLDELKPEWKEASQKGGALLAAVDKIIQSEKKRDAVVIYTDADISTNLGQTGLLLNKIMNGADVVVSSRWNEKSTTIGRGFIAKLSSWIYSFCVWILLGIDLSDTQNGFKAYKLSTLKKIYPHLKDLSFSFDTEWLAFAQKAGAKIAECELFWVDSSAESKVDTLRDSLRMFKNLLKQRKALKNCIVDK